MKEYITQCKQLSLTARMAIALLVFEEFCREKRLSTSSIAALSSHLWKWPLIDGPDEFELWERDRPELVNFGLGDAASEELRIQLNLAHIEESVFREIVSSLVDILWGSFWGAANDNLSLSALETVIRRTHVEKLPPLTPFKFSKFADRGGWGQKISQDDRNFWCQSYQYV